MSLASIIQQKLLSTVSDDQGKWRQFILDHLDYIKARSRIYVINADNIYPYRYDLGRYLKEKMNRHQDIAWIVLLLNSLKNEMEFENPGDYVVPQDDLIEKLYRSYMTTTGKQ